MPYLLALGLVNYVGGVYFNKATIDKGDVEPKIWGTDARNIGLLGGLAVATIGFAVGAPILLAIGLGAAGSSAVSKDTTVRIVGGLKQMVKDETDRQLTASRAPLQIPTTDAPGSVVVPPAPDAPAVPASQGPNAVDFASLIVPQAA